MIKMSVVEKVENTNKTPDMSVLTEMTKDFSYFLDMDSSKERQVFYDSIEEMLTKLDEFGAMVDAIRGDTRLCLNDTVPQIQNKCEEMKHIFARVDQLEMFVNIVKKNVNMMEDLVSKAENEMGSFSGIKKMFSSIVGSKKSSQQKDGTRQYEAPDIFVTEEYLRPVLPVEKTGDQPVTNSNQAVTNSNQAVTNSNQAVTNSDEPVNNDKQTEQSSTDNQSTNKEQNETVTEET